MRISLLASAFTCLCAVGLAPVADAVPVNKIANRNPAGACMLSIPTTDTGVRPKATGFRNEGAVSNFVICSFDIVTDSYVEGFNELTLYFASIDGAAHAFDCTGVDRIGFGSTAEYSTKPVAVPAGSIGWVVYYPFDFPTLALVGWNASVTCNLPPGVSIISVSSDYLDNDGD